MELKEAIEILKSLQLDRKSFIEDEVEHDSIFMQDYEAIDTVLQALEELQEENGKYRSGELLTANQVKSFEEITKKYYIHKDKIKEKIEEIKHKLTSKDFTHDMYIGTDKHIVWEHLCAKKDVLEELLKGE